MKKRWVNRGNLCRNIGCNRPARIKGLCRVCYDKEYFKQKREKGYYESSIICKSKQRGLEYR